jgi:RNA polymerase sigma-70 factor (ECF subfamily)
MSDDHQSTAQFEALRPHLTSVALRLLGSAAAAEDAVQTSWQRFHRADVTTIDNLGGWLTTVTARISLDMLRARATRREDPASDSLPEAADDEPSPEQRAELADSVGDALLVVLDTLAPAERMAFVLHDVFAVTFDEIGEVLGRSPVAAKQLAYRARVRLQGAPAPAAVDVARQRAVAEAFLAAAHSGDFEALLALLDPDIVLRADGTGQEMGSPGEVRTAAAVANVFCGRALGAEVALIDGLAALMWAPGGRPRVVWELTIVDGLIRRMNMVAAPESLGDMQIATG